MRYLLVATLVATLLAGCGASSDRPQQIALAALATPVAQAPGSAASPEVKGCDARASLLPPRTMPTPGAMPAGSYMATIQRRGYLLAGVNASLLGFGYLNPATGNQFEGFEIDLVHQIAKAIFGNPADVQFEALGTVSQRLRFIRQQKVDIVVDALTITCYRKTLVSFSTVYYDAAQKVLVPIVSGARGLEDLGGRRVCASAGSAPYAFIKSYRSHPIAVGEPQAIDCLVLLQQGRVDAISTDDSILLGFTAQDPYTKIVGPTLADAPYGMAISQAHPDFVRFVNGVLSKLRHDGTWRSLYTQALGRYQRQIPSAPPARYDG